MVEVAPFKAVFYDPALRLSRVIAPPYDQISPKMQEELYARDPHNFVRLIFGKILEGDSETSNRYTRAADDLHAWLNEKVLLEEESPCFYLYEQTFSVKNERNFTRLGLVGLMRLEPFGENVLPHEKTFAKPKEDRLSLMKACKANFEHIFFLYDDPKHYVRSLAAKVRLTEPFLTCRDDQGTMHSLWRIPPSETIAEIQVFFRHKQLLIADGHHRYETSLEYQRQMNEIWCDSTSDQAPFNFRLGTFVSLQDPGLVILPTHRVLSHLSPEQVTLLETKLPEYFAVENVPDLQTLQASLPTKRRAFGWVNANRFRILNLKDSFDSAKEFSSTPDVLRDLDVFLLQNLIFDRILKLPHEKLDQFVTYVRWPEDALALVKAGSHQAAFLLNPVKPTEMKAVSQAGEKMPHKSTDFYPKLWSGLVFYKMEM